MVDKMRSSVDAYSYQREGLAGRPSRQDSFDENGVLVHTSIQTWTLATNPAEIPGAMPGVEVARQLNRASYHVYAGESGPVDYRWFFYDDHHGYNFVAQIIENRATGSLTTIFAPKAPGTILESTLSV